MELTWALRSLKQRKVARPSCRVSIAGDLLATIARLGTARSLAEDLANLPGRVDPEGAVELERSVYRWKFRFCQKRLAGKLPPLGRPLRPPTPHLRCLLPHCLLHDRPQMVMKQPLGRLLACKVVRGSGTHHKHQPNRYFRTGPLPATKLEATLQSPSAIDCVSLNAIS